MRTIAMPADANANGDIFGGWLVSQMDLGAAVLARGTAQSRVTTVAIDVVSPTGQRGRCRHLLCDLARSRAHLDED
jgi:hypothetical protein